MTKWQKREKIRESTTRCMTGPIHLGRRLLNLPFRLNFKLLVQAFSQLQVEDSLWIPLTTCAPCGSGCFVSWLWLLCDPSMISIFTRLPWMLTPRRSLKRWRRQTPRRISPFLVALSRTGNQQHDQKIRRHARARVKKDASRGVKNANGVKQNGSVQEKRSIDLEGEPLSPWEDLWRQLKFEFQKYARVHSVPLWRRLSRCLYGGLYGANRKKTELCQMCAARILNLIDPISTVKGLVQSSRGLRIWVQQLPWHSLWTWFWLDFLAVDWVVFPGGWRAWYVFQLKRIRNQRTQRRCTWKIGKMVLCFWGINTKIDRHGFCQHFGGNFLFYLFWGAFSLRCSSPSVNMVRLKTQFVEDLLRLSPKMTPGGCMRGMPLNSQRDFQHLSASLSR